MLKDIRANEIGNGDFTIICDKCGSDDVVLSPTHYYDIGDYVNPKKITLTFRCRKCRNEYTVDIHNR